jgi:hypothetical protein
MEVQATEARPIRETGAELPPVGVVVGSSGSSRTEFKFEDSLKGLKRARKQEEMLRDSVVSSARDARKNSLETATWVSKAGIPNDPQSEIFAEFIRGAFGLEGRTGYITPGWDSQISKLLLHEDNGYGYFETNFEEHKGSIYLKDFAHRLPVAHGRWLRDGDEFLGVQQKSRFGGGYGAVIPSSKLLLLTRELQGSDWEGRGTLDSCRFDYEVMHHAMKMLAIALEQWAVNTPTMEYSQKEIMDNLIKGDLTKVEAIIKKGAESIEDYVFREGTSLIAPKGVTYSTLIDKVFKPDGIVKVLETLALRVQYAFLVQFLGLGSGSTGARSVGDTLLGFFKSSAQKTLDLIADAIGGPARAGGGVIGRLIEYNYGEVDPRKLPRLVAKGLNITPLAQSLAILPQLGQTDLLTDTDEFEDGLLDLFGQPPLTEEGRELRALKLRKLKAEVEAAERALKEAA